MADFEITVNGKRRFQEGYVRAITIVADPSASGLERVALHVGIGEAGDYEIQYLGRDLHPGDEILIRVLADGEGPSDEIPANCAFCGRNPMQIRNLVAGPSMGICDICIDAFQGSLTGGYPLPAGASIQKRGSHRCGFCLSEPPDVPGLVVTEEAAICPACLRAARDLTLPRRSGHC